MMQVMEVFSSSDPDYVNIDRTVQKKATALLPEICFKEGDRRKLRAGITMKRHNLRRTYRHEDASLTLELGLYTHARQFKRMQGKIKRQHSILARLIWDIEPKLSTISEVDQAILRAWLERATRLMAQKVKIKNRFDSLHAPEIECIRMAKTISLHEFNVRAGLVVTVKKGADQGARVAYPAPLRWLYITLLEQIEQARNLTGRQPKVTTANLGYRHRNFARVDIPYRDQIKRPPQQ